MSKPPPAKVIRLRGVRHNNLKGFDLDLPLGKLIVITGLSGSGKSSLAFDTLFAEGQRRYIETFSPYARQFFDRMDKPAVDSIEGIPPAIAIEQRNAVRSTRSTVGTMTEICDHLKVLWPHLATLHCRKCGKPVEKEPPQKIWEVISNQCSVISLAPVAADVRRLHSNAECLVTFDLVLSEKLSLKESLELIAKQGYQRLLVNGEVVRVEEAATHSALRTPHSVLTVIQDRLKVAAENRSRFIEACEQAYHFGKGRLAVRLLSRNSAVEGVEALKGSTFSFSNRFHCAECNLDYREPSPALFSFNHPVGACPTCKGFGRVIGIDYDLAVPDRSLSLAEGAVRPWRTGTGAESQADMAKFCKKFGVPMDVPFKELSADHKRWVIDGDPGYDSSDPANSWPKKWYGVKGYFRWLESKSYKMHVRVLLSRYRSYTRCPACDGKRLQPESLLYRAAVPDASRDASVSFPLTPALSLREREPRSPRLDETNPSRSTKAEPLRQALTAILPLPEGEGRGEGERTVLLTLADFYSLTVERALSAIERVAATHSATGNRQSPIHHALEEVSSRLRYLAEVGLGYLTLDRATRTLSGGETERVNLTTCLGTRLVNTLYVLDEPSVGLHPRDTARLVTILQRLRDLGNTVVVVEHEAAVMRAADQIVDLGPGHGETGGELVFQGTLEGLLPHPVSLTGLYLSGRKQVGTRERRSVRSEVFSDKCLVIGEGSGGASPPPSDTQSLITNHFLTLTGASAHNLKNLTLSIPLGRFVCLTGVSGSGKSTLVRDCLLPALEANLKSQISNLKTTTKASDRLDTSSGTDAGDEAEKLVATSSFQPPASSISGCEHLTRAILVDQSALGKTPRSNPAVYIGAFDDLRDLFAATELAKQRGLNSSAFSFNSAVGQCDRCRGAGFEKIEMQFLSDIFIKCPACEGRRYRAHILEVKVEARREGTSNQYSVSSVQSKRRSEAKAPLNTAPLNTERFSWSIADLLGASVDESLLFLAALPESKPALRAAAALRVLQEVGLGYLRLGQPINTLSGGESQRLKLAAHLAEASASTAAAEVKSVSKSTTVEEIRQWAKQRAGNAPQTPQTADAIPHPLRESQRLLTSSPTLFVFDEPTTGLHFDDVRVLVAVFQRLVDAGHSVLVIEHNLDVIRAADWLIDLGPEAGDAGGELVIAGTPEQVAACERSHTGTALRGETSKVSTMEAQA